MVCLRRLLEVDELPAPALAIAHLPLSHGGLGLTCAATLANPAFWSSWADSPPVLQTQLPQYAAQILQHLQHPSPAIPSIQAAAGAAQALQEHGWTPPNWVELAQGNRPNPADTDPEENAPRTRGWQQQATTPVHTAMSHELQAVIPPASQALLHSHTIPYTTEFEYPSHLFRILLLRRVRLHLPLSARFCRCRRPLDPLGDHRAACAQSGVLRARGGPFERAAARICREGGARVTTNTRLADLALSACLPKPELDPAPQLSAQPRHLLWCPAGLLSLPMQQPLPSLPVFCLKIFPPTTTWTEIFHPSANSSPTPAQLCRPVDSQPGRGRSGLTPSLPTAHLETAQYKHSLCLEAAQ